MEKKEAFEDPSGETDLHDVKVEPVPSAAQDVFVGQMLEVDATPKQERKVLWKLDLVYAAMAI